VHRIVVQVLREDCLIEKEIVVALPKGVQVDISVELTRERSDKGDCYRSGRLPSGGYDWDFIAIY